MKRGEPSESIEQSSYEVSTDQGSLSGPEVKAADPYGEGLLDHTPLEDEPRPEDILPDQIQRMEDEDERSITARPKDDIHPITASELK